MIVEETTRLLEIEVAHNVRHLGGYATEGEGRTSELLVRSAGLQRLTPRGLASLANHGISVIVDLRSTTERERDVTPEARGMQNIHAPVFETDASPEGLGDDFRGYGPVYRSMLNIGGEAYRTLFETILTADGGVLFHCAAGKDRTGLAAAMLLQVAGVPREVVLEDYVLSESLLAPLLPQWVEGARSHGREINEERMRALLASRPEAMETALDYLDERWGGAAGYMAAIGMTPSQIDELRARLIS